MTEILTKIENFQKVLHGKSKKVRHAAREIRLALLLHNSSLAGCREIEHSSIQIMPSEIILKEHRRKMKVRQGKNPETYGTLRDRLGLKHVKEIVTRMIVDEMRLKNDISFKCYY